MCNKVRCKTFFRCQRRHERVFRENKRRWRLRKINELVDIIVKNSKELNGVDQIYKKEDVMKVLEQSEFEEQNYTNGQKVLNLVTAKTLIFDNVRIKNAKAFFVKGMSILEKLVVRKGENSPRVFKVRSNSIYLEELYSELPIILYGSKHHPINFASNIDIVVDPCVIKFYFRQDLGNHTENLDITLRSDFSEIEFVNHSLDLSPLEIEKINEYYRYGRIEDCVIRPIRLSDRNFYKQNKLKSYTFVNSGFYSETFKETVYNYFGEEVVIFE